MISIGSSLKICLVAEGEADIYLRSGLTMEWNMGVAHAVVCEAGFTLNRYNNSTFGKHLYNKNNLLNDWFVVNGEIHKKSTNIVQDRLCYSVEIS